MNHVQNYTNSNHIAQQKSEKTSDIQHNPVKKRSLSRNHRRLKHRIGFWKHENTFMPIDLIMKDPLAYFSTYTPKQLKLLNSMFYYFSRYVIVEPSQGQLADWNDMVRQTANDFIQSWVDLGILDSINRNKPYSFMTNEYRLSRFFCLSHIRELLAPLFPALALQLPLMYLFSGMIALAQNEQLDENLTGYKRREEREQESNYSHAFKESLMMINHGLGGFTYDPPPINHQEQTLGVSKTHKEGLSPYGSSPMIPFMDEFSFQKGASDGAFPLSEPSPEATLPKLYSSQCRSANEGSEKLELKLSNNNTQKRMIMYKPKCRYMDIEGTADRKDFFRENPSHSSYYCDECRVRRNQPDVPFEDYSKSAVDNLSTTQPVTNRHDLVEELPAQEYDGPQYDYDDQPSYGDY